MTNRPRVLIADDHNLVAELCKRLLETEYDVVGIVKLEKTVAKKT
jgi:DNA-binding NarL/FixJ family response regulator